MADTAREMGQRFSASVLQLLFPRVCPLCGKILNLRMNKGNPYICPECYSKLKFVSGAGCLKCSRPLSDETALYCADCSRHKRWFDQGAALLIHDQHARKILYDLKYRNKRDHADMLAFEAAGRLSSFLELWKPEVIIPVPLHKKRLRRRGYNQAEVLSEKLSRILVSHQIRIPVDSRYLIRVRTTSAQKELSSEERERNMRGAFEIHYKEAAGKYRRILLVDDIYTSGATLSECARVLKEEGAEKVFFLTFSIG